MVRSLSSILEPPSQASAGAFEYRYLMIERHTPQHPRTPTNSLVPFSRSVCSAGKPLGVAIPQYRQVCRAATHSLSRSSRPSKTPAGRVIRSFSFRRLWVWREPDRAKQRRHVSYEHGFVTTCYHQQGRLFSPSRCMRQRHSNVPENECWPHPGDPCAMVHTLPRTPDLPLM